ncbi:uncharacterized protein ASCRUDRAFT_7472 [Ascoidea rubescens DSM 1968]|uniref:RAI1-like domain-containing protein n=1 Tax=Ascoidea rubescens DSM 1968 TaxID=1344418 RepID=A0A1D2VKA3_9ASCO|nr:hypothetical protein ASCRUDRAFT_7472 [Ascoidea rubescens DSM 1968]ODV62028.1 hypothetical protein ASCRUDRAFT_7472 [Ascoidea rubescens DSM 1968]
MAADDKPWKSCQDNISFLIKSRVDCTFIKPFNKNINNLKHYVEIKSIFESKNTSLDFTKLEMEKPDFHRKSILKFLTIYFQCLFGGMEKTVVVQRSKAFNLFKIKGLDINFIRTLLNSHIHKCLNWFGVVCEWILRSIPRDKTKAFRLKYVKKQKCLRLIEITNQAEIERTRSLLLLKEFIDHRKGL